MKKGISLIVLIITIIIILILAGAVILSLAKDNPISSANKSVFLNDLTTFIQELEMYKSNKSLERKGNYNHKKLQADDVSVTYNDLVDTTKNITDIIIGLKNTNKYTGEFAVVNGKLIYKGSDESRQNWAKEQGVGLAEENNLPDGTVITAYNKTYSGATIGYSYNNPVIPAGFVAVNTPDANWTNLSTDWNNGLVIQDTNGNEFVWVPVDGTNVKFEKWCTTGVSHTLTSEDIQPSGYNVSNITTKYKGFYIARYQSSNGGSNIVVSKKSRTVWNNINYTDSKTYSEQMASKNGYDTSKVGTMMINGTQWDTAIKWIQNSGKSVTDSRAWGNHYDSISPADVLGYGSLQVTGYNEYWKGNNIYDLVGNVWEWTSEIYSSGFIRRGGDFNTSGSYCPATYRGNVNGTYTSNGVGFRLSLYII